MGREIPILYKDGDGTTWSGTCDLIYRDRSGGVVAADYKTARVEGRRRASSARRARRSWRCT